MVNPLYVAENAPRAIRGGLTGIYQLFIVTGIFVAYWMNYGALLHITGTARYMVPLIIQGVPPLLLMVSMWLCNESPRHLAKQDKWEEALAVLSRIRALPADHPYVAAEFNEIRLAIEEENAILDGATWWSLQKEMWTVPSNRKRAIISILLMFFQQMTGNSHHPVLCGKVAHTSQAPTLSTTTPPRVSLYYMSLFGCVGSRGCLPHDPVTTWGPRDTISRDRLLMTTGNGTAVKENC
jgi:MFS family permease